MTDRRNALSGKNGYSIAMEGRIDRKPTRFWDRFEGQKTKPPNEIHTNPNLIPQKSETLNGHWSTVKNTQGAPEPRLLTFLSSNLYLAYCSQHRSQEPRGDTENLQCNRQSRIQEQSLPRIIKLYQEQHLNGNATNKQDDSNLKMLSKIYVGTKGSRDKSQTM